MAACLFCQLISEKKLNLIYEDDLVVAFPTNEPKAPVHLLIVPRKHLGSVNDVTTEDEPILSRLFLVAKQLAAKEGIDQSGYRVNVNTGEHAGQSVYHIHMHLRGGEQLENAG